MHIAATAISLTLDVVVCVLLINARQTFAVVQGVAIKWSADEPMAHCRVGACQPFDEIDIDVDCRTQSNPQ